MKVFTAVAVITAALSLAGVACSQNIVHPLGGGPALGGGPTILSPSEVAVNAQIGQLNDAAVAALDAGLYSEAAADARQSVSLGLGSGEGQELLAAALYAQGEDEEALSVYRTMALQGTDAPRNLLPYALLSLKAGDWSDALVAYEKALPLVSQQKSPVYPHLDQAFRFSLSDPQPAILATAIHVALGLTYDWGATWGRRSQAEKAQTEYQQALQIAPDWDMANYYYGDFLQRHGHTGEAQAAFAKVIKIGHSNVKLAARKALAKMKKPA